MQSSRLSSSYWRQFSLSLIHYDNTPIQYTVIFQGCKNDYFQMKKKEDSFLIFAHNIDCGYTLERVPTIYVWSKIKKIMYTPVNPSFTI